MKSKQAELSEEKQEAGAEFWETDEVGDARERTKGSVRRGKKKLPFMEHQVKNPGTVETRVKEEPEAIKILFECTPGKADAIDRRLKALGPGCRMNEAPALVAYELSGIPEDTYKGLASGQLIATMPPNEVKDVGTNPDVFAHDMATTTIGLPAEAVTGSPFSVKDTSTDTTDLPIEQVTATHTRSGGRALFPYVLMSLMIFFGLFCLYMGLKLDVKSTTRYGIKYKNVYSHRFTPFPTPSVSASTPILLAYPPTPAPQLGLVGMMKGISSGGGPMGRRW